MYIFAWKCWHPTKDFSAPRLFSSKTFQLQDFSAPIFSAPRLFSSKTFQLLDVSAPRLFSPRCFSSCNFSNRIWNFMQFVSNFQKNNARMTSFSIENHIYVHMFYLCTSKFCTFQQHYLNLLPLARILGVDKIGHSATWSR